MKLWTGRTEGKVNRLADDFNSSIRFDKRMYRQDIEGSISHAVMLGTKNIISEEEAEMIVAGLQGILADIENGVLEIDETAEDIHMFVETVLTERIGDIGKKLHTARSRNDQVALDMRMYLREETDTLIEKLRKLLGVLCDKAEREKATVLPGYTHLQRAQPVTFGHHLMAYAMMFLRDIDRLRDGRKRMNVSPIGSCALAGTTYETDRFGEGERLGFDAVCQNSMDGVSDRDFCVEFLAACSLIMTHLSRFSEEIILWASWEFKFVEIGDEFTTGSSIMPQKKNADMAELVRGKTGRVYGDLMGMLTVLKGLPLAYNKDMQEDKEGVFDTVDTVRMCLDVFTPMLAGITVRRDNMEKAAKGGFINATDLADYLVKKGLPFRSAYKISGETVRDCIAKGCALDELSLADYKKHSDLIEEDVYEAIALQTCVQKRKSFGGTSVESVERQIAFVKNAIIQ